MHTGGTGSAAVPQSCTNMRHEAGAHRTVQTCNNKSWYTCKQWPLHTHLHLHLVPDKQQEHVHLRLILCGRGAGLLRRSHAAGGFASLDALCTPPSLPSVSHAVSRGKEHQCMKRKKSKKPISSTPLKFSVGCSVVQSPSLKQSDRVLAGNTYSKSATQYSPSFLSNHGEGKSECLHQALVRALRTLERKTTTSFAGSATLPECLRRLPYNATAMIRKENYAGSVKKMCFLFLLWRECYHCLHSF